MPKEEKITTLHKIPDINPKIRQKGTLNILISKKYFEIALLYILCNKFYFGYGFHILPNVKNMACWAIDKRLFSLVQSKIPKILRLNKYTQNLAFKL